MNYIVQNQSRVILALSLLVMYNYLEFVFNTKDYFDGIGLMIVSIMIIFFGIKIIGFQKERP